MFNLYDSCVTIREKVGRTFVFFVSLVVLPFAIFGQNEVPTASPETNQSSGQTLDPITVVGQLNQARDQIVPYLGATKYSIGQTQIQSQPQDNNPSLTKLLSPRAR